MDNHKPTKSESKSNSKNLFWRDRYLLLHPWILAIFFCTSYFVANKDALAVTLDNLLPLLIFNLTVASACFIIVFALVRNTQLTAFASGLLVVTLLNIGRIFDYLRPAEIVDQYTIRTVGIIVMLAVLLIVGLATFILSRKNKHVAKTVNKVLFVFAASALVVSLISLVFTGTTNNGDSNSSHDDSSNFNLSTLPENPPDIYYIILDAYTRQDVLENLYDFDNSSFINGLRDRGFYVADASFANYTHTKLSVSSMLERDYINYLADLHGRETTNLTAAFGMLKENQTLEDIRNAGYKLVSLSTWNFTDMSDVDDSPIALTKKTELNIGPITLPASATSLVYFKNTILNPFVDISDTGDNVEAILEAFESAKEIPNIAGSKFAYIHLNTPHVPNYFREDGSINQHANDIHPYDQWPDKKGVVAQIKYVNKRVTELVDSILGSYDEGNQPIILLASDHGGLAISDLKTLDKEPVSGIFERQANLFSIYYPDGDYSAIYPSITPVNYLRLIFNKYLGQNFSLLEDTIYYSERRRQYMFEDVTEQMRQYNPLDLRDWRDYDKPSYIEFLESKN